MPNMNLNRSVYIGGDKIVKCIWQVGRIHVFNSQIHNHRFNSLDFTLKGLYRGVKTGTGTGKGLGTGTCDKGKDL